MATTLLANLFNPQVVGYIINKKLVDLMKFAPLAEVDDTLAGRPGDTLTMPYYSYIGDAAVLSENSELSVSTLVASTVSVPVVKIAKGVELTDEAILSGYGDPFGEAANQIALAIASQTDNMVLAKLHAITGGMLSETTSTSTLPAAADITSALELFGEDIDGVKVALVSPAVYTQMRANTSTWVPASEIAANIAVRGVVGEYQGCQVMVSNKLKSDATGAGDIYIVKPGALRIILKRDILVEYDRDILKFTNVITASKHLAAYLYDSSKAIRIATKS